MKSGFQARLSLKSAEVRSLASTAFGELTFSVIGGTIAYAGIEPWGKIVFLMMDGYVFKMIYAVLAVWPAAAMVIFLKWSEKVDVYDYDVNYSPFSIATYSHSKA